MHTSHRRNAHDRRKALPKKSLCLASTDAVIAENRSFAGVETAANRSEWTLAPFKTEGSDGSEKLPQRPNDNADILQQADRLFEMYITMEE